VALILKQAQVSRPTFYKYFSSAVDVIDDIVRLCNEDVERLFVKVFQQPQKEFYDYLPMALSGYLNWGRSQGLLMEARFRELHDLSSPVSRYRDEHNQRIVAILHDSMVKHGRTPPDDLALTSLVQGIEHLGYQFCMQAEHTEMPRYIEVMGRLCIAMLGNRHDWQEMMASPFFSRLLGLEES
jgi:AcrR family transcriptional regulator